MTLQSELPDIKEHIVLAFDMRSSTSVVENMMQNRMHKEYRDLLLAMRDGIKAELGNYFSDICNFTGDGWIFLLNKGMSGESVLAMVVQLYIQYITLFDNFIRPLLNHIPESVGLSFGADCGEVVRMQMFERNDYIGRAINVSCRLQTIAKSYMIGKELVLCSSTPLFESHLRNSGKINIAYRLDVSPLSGVGGGRPFQYYVIHFPGIGST